MDVKNSGHQKPPKAFVSYSWTSAEHREMVRSWADRLMADAVQVIIDVYDLREGHEKYHFMEKMVTDPSVTHVLVICDKAYAEKADARKAGVGTESQIISKEVYQKVEQAKFIPIICEFVDGNPTLPTFFGARIGIDFSTAEKVNENWEQLVRLLYGKPRFRKPELGTPPAYIREDTAAPISPVRAKFETLCQAILNQRPGVAALRRDFLDACISYSDALRTRKRPDAETFGEKIVETCSNLVPIRNALVDWVLLESQSPPSSFDDTVIEVLEELIEQRARPIELTEWNEHWFDAHRLFAYETFLYFIAALLKRESYETLRAVFTAHYLRPRSDQHQYKTDFVTFSQFLANSPDIQIALGGLEAGRRYLSTAAELIRRQASRSDLPFSDVMQAELLVQLMSLLSSESWFPHTLYYSEHSAAFPFFVRAARKRDFSKLAKITGIARPNELLAAATKGQTKFSEFRYEAPIYWPMLNLDKLGTL